MSQLTAAIEALIQEEVQRRMADHHTIAKPLSVKDFAEQTHLAASTVYGLVREGKLRTVDTGTSRVLIHGAEVDRLLGETAA